MNAFAASAPSSPVPPAIPAFCDDEAGRIRLATNTRTPAAVLQLLAADRAVTVRAAVAMNPAAPSSADAMLSLDQDERVRIFVAQRLARLLPRLPAPDDRAMQDHVLSVLGMLVQDAALRVRAAIAEAVKAMPEAPRDLILRLAHDHAIPVSEPVIRLSPVLTDLDLLALLATPPYPAAPVSVAQRHGLSPVVADAVFALADTAAIRALLANASATLRDATLDAIVTQATHPGATGFSLSPATTRALDEILQSGFIYTLLERAELAPALADALRCRVTAALAPSPRLPLSEAELLRATRQLQAAGGLTEAAIADAVRRGDHRRVAVQLAVTSGVPVSVVDRAAALHSAKGLISLVWMARMPMRLAVLVQSALGHCPPGQAMQPDDAGGFPMTEQEMRWHIDLLRR